VGIVVVAMHIHVMDISRAREESITVDTFSLEQLENLLAKFGDSVNRELPSRNTFNRSSSKDYRHEPEKNVHKLTLQGGNELKEETPMPQCQVEIPREDTHVCVLLRKKTFDRILLLFLISLISIGMILPFCLTIGTTIYERSSTAGFDFTYDETCAVSKTKISN